MKKGSNSGEVFVSLPRACEVVGLGANTVRNKAKECGAGLKIGRSYRIDIAKLLDYLRTFEG